MERKYQVIELSLLNKREFWEMLTLNFDRFYNSHLKLKFLHFIIHIPDHYRVVIGTRHQHKPFKKSH